MSGRPALFSNNNCRRGGFQQKGICISMENVNGFVYLILTILIPVMFIYGQDRLRLDYNTGVECGIRGDFATAKISFTESLRADSLYVPAKMNLMVVEEALTEKISKEAAILYFEAIRLGNRDSLDNKIDKLTQALQINPSFGLAYNERGIARAGKMEYENAIIDYDSALVFLPESPEIHFNKALSCYKSDRFQEAKEAFIKFIAYAPVIYKPYILYAKQRIKTLEADSTR
jgi:tetratricopeptide (TPR) repeat protein